MPPPRPPAPRIPLFRSLFMLRLLEMKKKKQCFHSGSQPGSGAYLRHCCAVGRRAGFHRSISVIR
ncbi:hypothetical protein E2C01_027685 [Portunus trituberculatus]|uniref:Uncharacterized protein n=1 Tax=Portunus trituberculatus TaxID=210409 RepID=A0A5B7EJC7_PORTR|nr:hypothetical protein [Portunus trituberculatus]